MATTTPISAAYFNPQSRAPEATYLAKLQAFLLQHPQGKQLMRHVASLGKIYPVFAAVRNEVRNLPNAQHYVNVLVGWANGGGAPSSANLSKVRSGIVALPLLLILQVGQYFCYLDHHDLTHAQFIAQVKSAGGIQGCCGGEPPALSIACATDEAQVVENAAVFLRIIIGVGAYIEALDDWTSHESTILAVRLKYEAQGEELMQKFPGVSPSLFLSLHKPVVMVWNLLVGCGIYTFLNLFPES